MKRWIAQMINWDEVWSRKGNWDHDEKRRSGQEDVSKFLSLKEAQNRIKDYKLCSLFHQRDIQYVTDMDDDEQQERFLWHKRIKLLRASHVKTTDGIQAILKTETPRESKRRMGTSFALFYRDFFSLQEILESISSGSCCTRKREGQSKKRAEKVANASRDGYRTSQDRSFMFSSSQF